MSTIDERIVGMRFDNAQFEQGIQTSMKSLNSLDKSLNLKNGTKGFGNIASAAGKLGLDGVLKAADTINTRFSTLGIMGVTALTRIANSAITTGTQLVKSLSVDPIMDGFREYELKMGSIQTILANTQRHGTGLKDVTKSLDELNSYADKTIYNFGDMTRNIGLFTNAGLKVDEASSMIKGFSNAAAASGTNAQGAAGAAYQLSQALSAGTIRLMDWRSLQNVGMGNKNMQQGLVDLATSMNAFSGKGIDGAGVMKDFNGSLEKGWLSADVMSNYLKIMAGDMTVAEQKALGLSDAQIKAFSEQQKVAEEAATKVRTWTQLISTLKESVGSGWAQTWDLVFGDFNQATDLFTGINDTLGELINGISDKRNKLLKEWSKKGGRDAAVEGFVNVWNALLAVAKPVQKAFSSVFKELKSDDLIKMTEAFRDFTKNLIPTQEVAGKLGSVFKGIFSVFSLGIQIVTAVAGAIGRLLGNLLPAGEGLLDFAANLGEWIAGVDKAAKAGDVFAKAMDWIAEKTRGVISWISSVGPAIKEVWQSFTDAFGKQVDLGFFDQLNGIKIDLNPFKAMRDMFGLIGDLASTGWSKVGPIMATVGDFLGQAFKRISDAFNTFRENFDIGAFLNTLNSGLLAVVLTKIIGFFKGLKDAKKDAKEAGGLQAIVEGLTGTLDEMQNTLKAGTLVLIAVAIGILALSAAKLATVDPVGLAAALGAITAMIGQLFGMMALFNKTMSAGGFANMMAAATGLILFSTAILILSSAVEKLGGMELGELAKGLGAVVILLGALTGVSVLLSKTSGSFMKGAAGLVPFAVALLILASAVEKLGNIEMGELAKGLGSVIVMLGALSAFLSNPKMQSMGLKTGVALIAVATGLLIMSKAVENLSSIEMGELAKGVGAVAALMAVLGGFTMLAGGAKNMVSVGVGMIAIGAAMLILSQSIGEIGSMPLATIAKGVIGMGAALLVIAGVMKLMTGAIPGALALMIIAPALLILANALGVLGGMSVEQIISSLVMLAGSLGIIAGAMALMTGALPGAAAILVISAALTILAPVLMVFAAMSLAEIGTSLLMLAGIFAVFAVAGLALAPVVSVLMLFAAALGLMGAAVMMAGVGVAALAVGLTGLAAAGAAGVAALVASISAIIGLIPYLAEQIGAGIIALLASLAGSIAEVVDSLVTIGVSLLEGLGELIPAVVDFVTNLLTALIDSLGDVTSSLIEYFTDLTLALLDAIVVLIPEFSNAGMDIVLGVMSGIESRIGEIVDKGAQIAINFMNGVSEKMPEIGAAASRMVNTFVTTVVNATLASTGHIKAEGKRLLDGLTGGAFSAISEGAGQVPGKISGFVSAVTSSISGAAGRVLQSARDLGGNIISGMVSGISGGIGRVTSAARDVASSALTAAKNFLGIKSPSREFIKIGKFVREGFAKGIESGNRDDFLKAFKDMKEDAQKLFNDSVADYKQAKAKLKDLQSKEKKLEKGKTTGTGKNKKTTVDKKALKKNRAQQKELKATMATAAYERDRAQSALRMLTSRTSAQNIIDKETKSLSKLKAEEKQLAKIKKPTSAQKKELSNNRKAQRAARKAISDQKAAIKVMNSDDGGAKRAKTLLRNRKEASKENKAAVDAVKKLQVEGKKLAAIKKPNAKDRAAIKANREAEAKAQRKVKKTAEALAEANAKLYSPSVFVGAKKELDNLTKSYEKLQDKIKSAEDNYRDALKVRNDYAASMFDKYSALGALPTKQDFDDYKAGLAEGLEDLKDPYQQFFTDLRQQVEDTNKFNKLLADLRTLGLNDTMYQKLMESGTDSIPFMEQLLAGGKSAVQDVNTLSADLELAAKKLSDKAAKELYQAGVDAAKGILDGLKSQRDSLKKEMETLAGYLTDAVKKTLKIKSPSRVMAELGAYAGEGLAQGISGTGKLVESSAVALTNNTLDSMREAIRKAQAMMDADLGANPTIAPVIDLSNIQSGMSDLNGLLSVNTPVAMADYIRASGLGSPTSGSGAGEANATQGGVVFNQYNNSPKSLSSGEIYRQTKNQLSVIKQKLEV